MISFIEFDDKTKCYFFTPILYLNMPEITLGYHDTYDAYNYCVFNEELTCCAPCSLANKVECNSENNETR